MLTDEELDKIKNSLEKSQNPLFFFDNDADGFCSFIIFQKSIQRGKGVAIKTFPELDETYLRKVNEINPDHIFILDKPLVSRKFFEGIFEKGIPITWIDHHDVAVEKDIVDKIEYFNSFPSSEPITYLAYKVFKRKTEQWLAFIGCIADHYMPDFAEEYAKENKEFVSTIKSPFDCMYKTEIGKIMSMINFQLKDTTTNVLKMIRLFIKSNGPADILDENYETRYIHQKYKHLTKHMNNLLAKTKFIDKNIVSLEYAGEIGLTSELANRLNYENPKKYTVVIYKKQGTANVSIRGKRAKDYLSDSIKEISGATGGGHADACGARIPMDKLDEFREKFYKNISR